MDTVISLRDITFSYNGREPVLNKCSFSLKWGERIGLTGPNGSGKTTLFHIIMGLLKPEKGDIEIFGKVRKEEADFREVREKIGLLFQDPEDQLFCPTVEEDVAFGPLNLGIGYERAKVIVREILDLLRISDLEGRITYRLSGGEKRLVSLATVLAMKPEVLLLDEPTSELDENTRERIIEVIQISAPTLMIISHDQNLLERTTHAIYEMRGGNLYRRGL